MNKKRILFVTESRQLASGFGTYAKEVLPRLYKTEKYELAEFSCYCSPESLNNTDWLVYGVAPMQHEKEYAEQHANPAVQWGVGRFEYACLDFKPDIVATFRDPWMDSYIVDSPFLNFFHWVWMPTVDSEPQKNEWLYWFNRCDGLLAYSEYGKRTLENQTHGRLKVSGCASPAIDPNLFKIIPDKGKHKQKFGLPSDSFIVGTVMRNQKRKMFPDLLRSFKMFINKASEEIAKKSFLYLHTSYPEKMGWDITSLVHEFDLGSKVLTTYACRHCNKYFISHYRNAITVCDHCGNHSATMPGVSNGIDHKELVNIYNLMDLYVQYAICEGFGMPQVEAAACGVPIAAIDYSAMEDVLEYTHGYPIKPKLERELETNADRSGQNNEDLSKLLLKCSSQTKEQAKLKRLETRKGCISRYTWDNAASSWEIYFDEIDTTKKPPWDSPRITNSNPINDFPKDVDNRQFCEWLFTNLVQDQYHLFSYKMLNVLRNLNFGAVFAPGRLDPCTKENLFNEYKSLAQRRVVFDQLRCSNEFQPQQFVIEAHRRVKK